jgi:asparagine synthase (glutamine-hydrolysing)
VDAELVAGVLRMLDAQVHRGPDDWGILVPDAAVQDSQVRALLSGFASEHVRTYPGSATAPAAVLGARRLSIIDLSPRGRMPMGNADARVWVTYNGEVYNYRELRSELENRGYPFQSDTDTEAILHGYEEWGEEVVQRLRGMFAFAILDFRASNDPKLFLAKDRFGIKPLYWARRNCILQFASEVRALMACGVMPNQPEPRGLHGFLVHGSVPAPFTTVRDVFSLPAAHSLSIDDRTYSYPKPRHYWYMPKCGTLKISPEDAISETRRLLDESVRLRLVSDVPLGVFLSGGMDSSAITALASKHLPHQLTTLCVTFDEEEFSEEQHAARVANRFGCKHVQVRLRAQEFIEEIPKIMAAMDQPSIDGVNTYFVAKAARMAGLTVALSGLGGDEIFCGYPGHRAAPRIARAVRFPLVRLSALMAGALGKHFGYERLEKLEFLRDAGALGCYLAIRGLFPPRRAARLLEAGVLPLGSTDPERKSLTFSEYAEMDISLYLQNQLLRDSDVFGMAHSLEIRVPFLDHRLAEFVLALPQSLKTSPAMNKPLLASAVAAELGSETKRPKMGFIFPFERWLLAHSQEALRHSQHASQIQTARARAIWDAFDKGRIHWSRPWALAVLGGMEKLGTLAHSHERADSGRILFLLPDIYSTKGGISVYNQNLLRAVGEVFPGSELRVISVNDKAMDSKAPVQGRVHFKGCGPRSSILLKTRVVFASLAEALWHRPDLVISGHINLAPLTLLLSAVCSTDTALLAYGIEAWNPKPALRWAARQIQRVFPISHFTAGRMANWGIKPDRMRLLHVTVDGEVFRPIRRARTGGPVLLTVARLDYSEAYKGVDQVLRALRLVRTHHPDVRYVIAGNGDDVPRLKALAREVGVGDCVDFRGFVPDEALPALYGEADLFVMPSQKEGFGIVFLEALASGVPVIAGTGDGSEDAVLQGRAGVLVDPETPGQLVESICKFLDGRVDGNLRDPARLRRLTLDHYGFDPFRERIHDLFLDAWGETSSNYQPMLNDGGCPPA